VFYGMVVVHGVPACFYPLEGVLDVEVEGHVGRAQLGQIRWDLEGRGLVFALLALLQDLVISGLDCVTFGRYKSRVSATKTEEIQ